MSLAITVGEKYCETILFKADDVLAFAEVSKDKNPLHTDSVYCRQTRFGKPIVHGALLFSHFSRVFGTIWPGEGSVYLKQNLEFLRPIFVGDDVTLEIECIAIDSVKKRVTFLCTFFNLENKVACRGEAELYLPNLEK